MSDQLPEFLTVAEVATRFRVSDQTVYRWIETGALAAVKIGGRTVRIRSTSVSEMLTRDASCGKLKS